MRKQREQKKPVDIFGTTTGSGKTLTSFKTAILASNLADIDKVLFVVDREDLDYQTMKEYNTFQKDSANGTRNTRELERRLTKTDIDKKIIITTIQKLGIFIQRKQTTSNLWQAYCFNF